MQYSLTVTIKCVCVRDGAQMTSAALSLVLYVCVKQTTAITVPFKYSAQLTMLHCSLLACMRLSQYGMLQRKVEPTSTATIISL